MTNHPLYGTIHTQDKETHMLYNEDGVEIIDRDEAAVLAVVDEWLSEGQVDDPDDDELLDIAAIMAAHDENPWG